MKFLTGTGLAAALVMLTGCALFHSHKKQPQPNPPQIRQQGPTQGSGKPVIKPDLRVSGEVAMVNAEAKFAVVSFPPGPVPPTGQHLNVYHQGVKVGELKITGPQHDNDTVADIVAGDLQPHDEARVE